MKKIPLLTVLLFFVFFTICFSDTIHVPADQPTIQAGIDAAENGDIVLVAPGTYVERIDFIGKAIAVKSSGGVDVTLIDGKDQTNFDNKSVVSFSSNEGADSLLEGFTLINGQGTNHEYSPGKWKTCGGGIYCNASSPTIRNNHITKSEAEIFGGGIFCANASPMIEYNHISWNYAHLSGGGICCQDGSSPIVRKNTIVHNSARHSGGALSGGLDVIKGNTPAVIKNFIAWNWAESGGGIFCSGPPPVFMINNNVIFENKAAEVGGGICCAYNGDATIVNNTIVGNTAAFMGGGIYYILSSSTITNNIIAENYAESGGGIHFWQSPSTLTNNTFCRNSAEVGGGINCATKTELTAVNTIFWDNSATKGPEIHIGNKYTASTLNISYSVVKGGQAGVHVEMNNILDWGDGMIEDPPAFVDIDNNDLHLLYTSPCRNAGDNSSLSELADFEGDPRIAQGIVDIGADEFHNHLYFTGDFIPRGSIEGKFIGLPDTGPVGLFIGSGVLDPPLTHMWGDFYLEAPWIMVPLVPIPSNGLLMIAEQLPDIPVAPYDIPMQALIGWELSNLFVLEVR